MATTGQAYVDGWLPEELGQRVVGFGHFSTR
jgi:hypothetical protein